MRRICWYVHKPLLQSHPCCCCSQLQNNCSLQKNCCACAYWIYTFPFFCWSKALALHSSSTSTRHTALFSASQAAAAAPDGMQGLPNLQEWTQQHMEEQHSPPGPFQVLISNGSNHAIEVSVACCLFTSSSRSDLPSCTCHCAALFRILFMYSSHSNGKSWQVHLPLLLVYRADSVCNIFASFVARCRW